MTFAGTAVTEDRLHIHRSGRPETGSFAADVRDGLLGAPKRLPAKYLYDEVGSALFDAITLLPEYYLTRKETAILREWGWEIVRAIGNPVAFFELGSGSAVKTCILIEEALRAQRSLQYHAVDIAEEALTAAARKLTAAYPALTVHAHVADYTQLLASLRLQPGSRTLAMFMGSNLGNYDPPEATALVAAAAAALQPGDGLLLGIDLDKPAEVLERAYDDASGVTAAFNYNLLARMNRELGASFDRRDFAFRAAYDAEHRAVRSFLEARRDLAVPIPAIGEEARFFAGERIHTESSYKFSPQSVEELAQRAGLRLARVWTDADEWFCVALLRKDAEGRTP